jgi:uncharacterized protein YneF (UPF0154 family)
VRRVAPAPASLLRTQDAVRGVLIAVVSAVAGYVAIRPPGENEARFSLSPGSLAMIAIGVALQVVVIGGNWLARRYERAHGLDGQLAPVARQILQLVADGVSVLLIALGVFGGIFATASSI